MKFASNEKFIKSVQVMTNFVSKIDKKNIFRGVNFTNLKTPAGYIAKSKPQRICL